MKTISYSCKFCHTNRSFECEWNDGCEQLNLAKWIANIACDRCAKFERSRRDLEHKLMRCAFQLTSDRRSMKPASQTLKDAEGSAVNALTSLLQHYAKIVCEHYRVETTFQPEFVDIIFEKPEKAGNAIGVYHRMIRQISRDPANG